MRRNLTLIVVLGLVALVATLFVVSERGGREKQELQDLIASQPFDILMFGKADIKEVTGSVSILEKEAERERVQRAQLEKRRGDLQLGKEEAWSLEGFVFKFSPRCFPGQVEEIKHAADLLYYENGLRPFWDGPVTVDVALYTKDPFLAAWYDVEAKTLYFSPLAFPDEQVLRHEIVHALVGDVLQRERGSQLMGEFLAELWSVLTAEVGVKKKSEVPPGQLFELPAWFDSDEANPDRLTVYDPTDYDFDAGPLLGHLVFAILEDAAHQINKRFPQVARQLARSQQLPLSLVDFSAAAENITPSFGSWAQSHPLFKKRPASDRPLLLAFQYHNTVVCTVYHRLGQEVRFPVPEAGFRIMATREDSVLARLRWPGKRRPFFMPVGLKEGDRLKIEASGQEINLTYHEVRGEQ